MVIKVVKGNPTPEELAAALAVVRARGGPRVGAGGRGAGDRRVGGTGPGGPADPAASRTGRVGPYVLASVDVVVGAVASS